MFIRLQGAMRPLQNDTKVVISSSPGLPVLDHDPGTGGSSVFKDFLDSPGFGHAGAGLSSPE
jgi:hypothetical protein